MQWRVKGNNKKGKTDKFANCNYTFRDGPGGEACDVNGIAAADGRKKKKKKTKQEEEEAEEKKISQRTSKCIEALEPAVHGAEGR